MLRLVGRIAVKQKIKIEPWPCRWTAIMIILVMNYIELLMNWCQISTLMRCPYPICLIVTIYSTIIIVDVVIDSWRLAIRLWNLILTIIILLNLLSLLLVTIIWCYAPPCSHHLWLLYNFPLKLVLLLLSILQHVSHQHVSLSKLPINLQFNLLLFVFYLFLFL